MSAQVVAKNKHVLFSYTIVDADRGDVLEQVEIPMEYVHGGEQRMFGKVEKAMEGAGIGDKVEVTLKPEDTFGKPDPELIFTESVDNVPSQFHQVGAAVEFQNDQGNIKSFIVTEIEDNRITIDGNSPLVGKTLTFRVIIHDIRDATDKEIITGLPAMPSIH